MAKYFKILQHKDKECLHLKLRGDFDGSSAFELINALKKTGSVSKIYIHAERLKTIYTFGSEVFEKHMNEIKGPLKKILFTGKKDGLQRRKSPGCK
jgi:hypothetical protein